MVPSRPPEIYLTTEEPNIPVELCDVTRRFVGFGRVGLVKLRRELHHKDVDVQIAAITSIIDLVRDSEILFYVLKMDYVKRLTDLIVHYRTEVRERALLLLKIFATTEEGRIRITKVPKLIENLALLMEDPEIVVRLYVTHLLKALTDSEESKCVLNEQKFIKLILQRLQLDPHELVIPYLQTLQFLISSEEQCRTLMQTNGFRIIRSCLNHSNGELVGAALYCLMELTSIKTGRNLAYKEDLLVTLSELVHDERPEIHIPATGVIMNCTIKIKTKVVAAEFTELPLRLIKLAKNPFNRTAQIYCLKALTNICEYPKTRKFVKNNFMEEYWKINVAPDIKELKTQLDALLF